MYKRVNNERVKMTQEEIAEMERMQSEMPVHEKTAEERLAEVEEKLDILDIILGGA